MIMETQLNLPENVNASVSHDSVRNVLELKFPSVELKVPCDVCLFQVKDRTVKVTYLKKNKRKLSALIGVWKNSITKYSRDPTFLYTILPVYAHFPVSVTVRDKDVVVSNFLGLKKQFTFHFQSASDLRMEDKKILVTTKNDVATGAQVYKMKTLKYKTMQKNLDLRRFRDGFLIRKKEL